MLSAEPSDTDSLRGDVLALLRRTYAGLGEIGLDTIFGLLSELYEEPEVLALLNARDAGEEVMRTILTAAGQRGRYDPVQFPIASSPCRSISPATNSSRPERPSRQRSRRDRGPGAPSPCGQ